MSLLIPATLSINTLRARNEYRDGRISTDNKFLLPGSDFPLDAPPSEQLRHTSTEVNLPAQIATPSQPLVVDSGSIDVNLETSNLSTQFDEYGAELGKEARIWKVYVKETDKWDTELVEGWNKSLDVILVFAALFAAVATAFLIESSKKLQEDPVDVSAKALLLASQSLLAVASTQAPQPNSLLLEHISTPFQPTQHSIIINALWYLSLSLSIATSLMAMFAKDWCHSFISNRNGEPWLQARRRQQKWMMIERWGMQELLLVLPSLIHLSLLLFAIGLCIYVHDLNSTVAIPVICVTAVALTFYIVSSVTASISEFFPYTTIISKVLRSAFVYKLFKSVPWVLGRCLMILGRFIWNFLKHYSYVVLTALFFPCGVGLTHMCVASINRLTGGCGPSSHDTLGDSAYAVFRTLLDSCMKPGILFIAELRTLACQYVPKIRTSNDHQVGQDKITSLALNWLIENCETPSSIAIALQAIAGANKELQLGPLRQCHATLHILRRLASSNRNRDLGPMQISLYTRALKFLGDHAGGMGELGVMIWDLQVENEKQVVKLISQEQFIPSDHNLKALRIGSAAASSCLRLLNEGSSNLDTLLGPLQRLFSEHFDNSKPLHSAALVSLVNAAVLLGACSPITKEGWTLMNSCVQLLHGPHSIGFKAAILVAFIRQSQHYNPSDPSAAPDTPFCARRAVQTLVDIRTWSRNDTKLFVLLGRLEFIANADPSVLVDSKTDRDLSLIPYTRSCLDRFLNKGIPNLETRLSKGLVMSFLQAITRVYQPTSTMRVELATEDYIFVLRCACNSLAQNLLASQLWTELISFADPPMISWPLVEILDRENVISLLKETALSERRGKASRCIAAIALWLLISWLQKSSGAPKDLQRRVRAQLEEPNEDLDLSQGVTIAEIGKQLEAIVLKNCCDIYSYRVAECILETREDEGNRIMKKFIAERLADTPLRLRGLPSLIETIVIPASEVIGTQPSGHVSMTIHPTPN